MNHVLRILRFLRITDESDNLSLTNILVGGIFIKIMMSAAIDPIVMTGFIMSLLQYGHKRHVMLKQESTKEELITSTKEQVSTFMEEIASQVNKHEDTIEKLEIANGFKKVINDE